MNDFFCFILDGMAQFAGGRGEIANELVRFGLASVFWGILLIIAWARNRKTFQAREQLLIWGFALGLIRELLMLGVFTIEVYRGNHLPLHGVFPPLEHTLSLAAIVVVAAAFVQYILNASRWAKVYLGMGLATIAVAYLSTFSWWATYIKANPGSQFGHVWCDWLFHIIGCVLIAIPLLVLARKQGWLRNLMVLALLFFFFDEFLKLADLASNETYQSLFAPIRHSLHLWGIPLLGYVYLTEMTLERNLLAAVIEQSADGVVVMNPGGRIQYVNPAFTRHSGFASEDVLDQDASLFRSDKNNESLYTEIWTTLKRGEVWKGRLFAKNKEGHLFETERTFFPVRTASDGVVNFVSLWRDVSKETEMERQLAQAQKLQAIGTLAGGIAHDFNNLLSPIIGYTEMALMKIEDQGILSDYLKNVLKAAERGKNLVNQILTISRQSEQGLEPVRIGPIIKETLKLLRASLPATIELRCEILARHDLILGDACKVHQILLNLVTNSAQSIGHNGGWIDVRLDEMEVASVESSPCSELLPGAYLKLTVRDNGCGMTAETEKRIFEPFFTTKTAEQGTGLGLAVVQGIVQSHKGGITIDSAPDSGTTFNIYLPQGKPEPDRLPSRKVENIQGKERILLIDDEEEITRVGELALSKYGYQVITSNCGHQALEMFRKNPCDFDLVVTDQAMPGMTGTSLAREIQGIRQDIPVILCSGFSPTISMEEKQATGIRECLDKPLKIEEFIGTIRRVLNERVLEASS